MNLKEYIDGVRAHAKKCVEERFAPLDEPALKQGEQQLRAAVLRPQWKMLLELLTVHKDESPEQVVENAFAFVDTMPLPIQGFVIPAEKHNAAGAVSVLAPIYLEYIIMGAFTYTDRQKSLMNDIQVCEKYVKLMNRREGDDKKLSPAEMQDLATSLESSIIDADAFIKRLQDTANPPKIVNTGQYL